MFRPNSDPVSSSSLTPMTLMEFESSETEKLDPEVAIAFYDEILALRDKDLGKEGKLLNVLKPIVTNNSSTF